MTKTRIIALLLVLVMTMSFALTGCGLFNPPTPPTPDGGGEGDGGNEVVDPNAENYAAAIELAKSWGTEDYLYYKQNAITDLWTSGRTPPAKASPATSLSMLRVPLSEWLPVTTTRRPVSSSMLK